MRVGAAVRVPNSLQATEGRVRFARRSMSTSALAWAALASVTLLFLTVPSVIVVLSSISDTEYLTFPPQGATLRWYGAFLASPEFMGAFRTSLSLAAMATTISLIVGTMAAFALDRLVLRWRSQIVAAFLSPLVVPMLVTGIALLQFFARVGVPRSFLLLLFGHLLICIPYVVRMMLSSLAGFDRSIEEAAMNLGASPVRAIVAITLPNIAPGLLAAAIFAFIESFGNLSLSAFVAGPRASTLPVRLFTFIEFSYDSTVTAVSTVILVVTLAAMLLLARVASLEKLF